MLFNTKLCLIVLFISFIEIKGYKEEEENHKWFGEINLDQLYLFKWSPDPIKKEITIRVEVQTKGWVSFGFSKHGFMNELDMVIGWVDDEGISFFNDYWVDQSFKTSLDRSQDWNLLSASENSTHTVLEFSRKYVTCDDVNDLQIYENEYEISNIVFAYSFEDPTDGTQTIGESSKKGLFHRNLFTPDIPFKPQENDIEIIDFSSNITLLANEYKQIEHLRKIDLEDHMIIKFEPIYPVCVQNHHMAITQCDPKWAEANYEKHYKDKYFSCFNPDDPLRIACLICSKSIAQMSIESNAPVVLPENVGISLSGTPYVLIDVHLLNIKDHTINISPSIRIWTTKQKRQFEGFFFVAGLAVGTPSSNWGFIIAPRQQSFKISGVSSTYCLDTQNEMGDTGIFLFSMMFHSHSGNEMEFRHYRNDKILRVLHKYQYSYRNQPWISLKTPINLKKTDKLVVICDYNTLNSDKPLLAPEEHCLLGFYYYPKLHSLSHRAMAIGSMAHATILNITGLEQIDFNDGSDDKTIIRRPTELNNTKLIDFINSNEFHIKNPKEFERTQLLANMNECCNALDFDVDKPCKCIGKPPGLYEAIMEWEKPNTCTKNKNSNTINRRKKDLGSHLYFPFKNILDSFKVAFKPNSD